MNDNEAPQEENGFYKFGHAIGTGIRWTLKTLLILGGLWFVVAFVGGMIGTRPLVTQVKETERERIERGCRKEYGDEGEGAVTRCRLRLLSELLLEGEAEKLERARNFR